MNTTKNPSKYIRQAYISALQSATGLKVWDRLVPKNTVAPPSYIILDGQTRNETVNAKGEYFEWLSTIDVNIYYVGQLGYSYSVQIDDIEEKVINAIRFGVPIEGFSNKDTRIIDSMSLDTQTSTQSIERRVIKFEHWVCVNGQVF